MIKTLTFRACLSLEGETIIDDSLIEDNFDDCMPYLIMKVLSGYNFLDASLMVTFC